MSRPLIGVTAGQRAGGPGPDGPRVRPRRAEVFVAACVVDRLREAGARVVLLPPGDAEVLDGLPLDGAVITGGAFDIHPRHFGAVADAHLGPVDEARTLLELAIVRRCVASGTPLLGLCGGMQAIGVGLGGSLFLHIPDALPGALEHEQPTDPATPWHPVALSGRLAGWVAPEVNSTHHQALDRLGPLRVVGRAPDGVVEAVELPDHPWCIGVQWHPELLPGRLFEAFVDEARRRP